MSKCDSCIHMYVCRRMNKWTTKSNNCGDYYEKPKKGKWIRKTVNFPPCYDGILVNECSECKDCFVYHDSDTNFCPNCGADMRGGKQ